ncbi:hypothetical protein Ddye_020887 [Dipteronia dyeriana]|uniref:HSF-type DNA-binding domain-containing protein n=1 Tax=Dipteronia dyeriana TaxID=168575 RepID=A0AAD9WX65_9ROSI|nr:hypothetical protein Ddye_020887 [Dipteronia dyeriana]
MDTNNVIAPFIMKTYQMVNDPTTDMLIIWSRANNSFIVIEPLDFSQRILPAYFKHNNFSSFVRQLNTYGFRKVDPDRWEFANEWFLRGQKQLLKNIIRRKHSKNNHYMTVKAEDLEDEEIVMEIARLKQEQKSLDEDLEGMNKRLEATERRPQQMMAFLCKVVEDPDLLPRMVLQKERTKKLVSSPSGDKKRRFMISSSLPSSSSGMTTVSSSIKSEEEQEDSRFDIYNLCQSSSPENSISGWFGERQLNYGCVPNTGQIPAIAAPPMAVAAQGNSITGQMGYFGDMVGGMDSSPPPPYPFSLLGGGF